MRIVEESKLKPGTLEVSWMWLPTFIGQNSGLLRELDRVLSLEFPPPFDATEDQLDAISEFALGWLFDKHSIPGLREYLGALKHVRE